MAVATEINYPVSGNSPTTICLGDVLNDELLQATEFLLLYITQDGQHKSLCMGEKTSKFTKDNTIAERWKNNMQPKTDSPKYKCLNCRFNTNYLQHMVDHHRNTHPEFMYLSNDQKWVSHYSKFTKRNNLDWKATAAAAVTAAHQQPSNIDKYRCPHCNYKSLYYQNMAEHLAAEHGQYGNVDGIKVESESLGSAESQTNASDMQELSHSGSEDDSPFKEEEADEEHVENVGPPAEVAPPETTSSHSRAKVACEFCRQKFDHKRLKDIHVKACHLKDGCYHCPHCKHRVPCDDWPEHMKQHRAAEGNAFCELCQKTFKSMRNLKNHRIEVHEEGKVHACPEPNCASVFARVRNLRMHMALHKGSKQHVCDICGEGYALKSSLSKHRKTKHADEVAMADAWKNKNKQMDSTNHAPLRPSLGNGPGVVAPQVQGKVLMPQPADGNHVLPHKPGNEMNLHQDGAPVLGLPQQVDPPGQQVEGRVPATFVVPTSQPNVPPLVHSHSKKVIRRQSSLDLGDTKIKRQSPLDFGVENHGRGELMPQAQQLPMEDFSRPRCRYCKDLYFDTTEQLKSHILDVHKVTSSQDAADLEQSKDRRPEAKIKSQFSNTPHTQLSEDLIEAAYLLSLQHEQQQQQSMQVGAYSGIPPSDANIG